MICHNSYNNKPSCNCPTTVLVRITQAAITKKPHSFSGLTQWKLMSPLLKCPMQEASSTCDCCVLPPPVSPVINVWLMEQEMGRRQSHSSKGLAVEWHTPFLLTFLWLNHTHVTTSNCKRDWVEVHLCGPKRGRKCVFYWAKSNLCYYDQNVSFFLSTFLLNVE